MCSSIDRISIWLNRLRQNDSVAAFRLWRRYYDRLRQIARRKLQRYGHRIAFDDEDIALSALDSFCRNVKKGRFPDINSTEDIWCLLVVIALRKANDRVKTEFAAKRGGDVEFYSVENGDLDIVDSRTRPDSCVELEDLTDHLFGLLGDELRGIVCQKLSGDTNSEIAEQMGRTRQTVQRKLRLIRDIWLHELDK